VNIKVALKLYVPDFMQKSEFNRKKIKKNAKF